jgi:hypothetical protein
MEIQKLIDLLTDYRKRGARTVDISDGAWTYEFNHRFQSVPNYSAPYAVILRPVSNGDGREIDFFETLEDRAKPRWSTEYPDHRAGTRAERLTPTEIAQQDYKPEDIT